MRLFGTSGIRTVFDASLLQVALKVGLAAGKDCGNVVVGGDPRTSSEAMKHAVLAGLLSAGARYGDAGTIPTPTLAFAAQDFDAGIMITASHNPPQYNGIKLLNPDGSAFDSRQRHRIEETIASNQFITTEWSKIGTGSAYSEAIEKHIQRILRDFPGKHRLKVAVDCGCGAASLVTPRLLSRLGCEVIALNCYPSGFFPRDIEPTEANLRDLIKLTGQLGADLGIAHDGDSDRMMAVDDKGRFIPGDKLLAIFAQAKGARKVVTTIDASMSIEEMGFKVVRTRVGDNYVSDELKRGGDFGGEPSGAWVFPEISLCPDGIYAAAQVVAIASQQKLSKLVDAIPNYPLLRGSVSSEGVAISELESRLTSLKPNSVIDADGIRLGFEDGWLLIRPSGTEPKVRVTAEARTEMRAGELYEHGIRLIKECVH